MIIFNNQNSKLDDGKLIYYYPSDTKLFIQLVELWLVVKLKFSAIFKAYYQILFYIYTFWRNKCPFLNQVTASNCYAVNWTYIKVFLLQFIFKHLCLETANPMATHWAFKKYFWEDICKPLKTSTVSPSTNNISIMGAITSLFPTVHWDYSVSGKHTLQEIFMSYNLPIYLYIVVNITVIAKQGSYSPEALESLVTKGWFTVRAVFCCKFFIRNWGIGSPKEVEKINKK